MRDSSLWLMALVGIVVVGLLVSKAYFTFKSVEKVIGTSLIEVQKFPNGTVYRNGGNHMVFVPAR